MHTTDYHDTFIAVAEDCPVVAAQEPPTAERPTIARTQWELIADAPYTLTSDDVVFTTHARRAGIPAEELEAARAAFFSQGQPCLRSSPLAKRYGWGIHSDAQGRVALVPLGAPEYERFLADPALAHTRAMRSRRA